MPLNLKFLLLPLLFVRVLAVLYRSLDTINSQHYVQQTRFNCFYSMYGDSITQLKMKIHSNLKTYTLLAE